MKKEEFYEWEFPLGRCRYLECYSGRLLFCSKCEYNYKDYFLVRRAQYLYGYLNDDVFREEGDLKKY